MNPPLSLSAPYVNRATIHGAGGPRLFPSQFIQAPAVLYTWTVLVVLCGIGSLPNIYAERVSAFVLLNVSVLIVLGAALLVLRKHTSFITLIAYLFLAFFPAQIFSPILGGRLVFVDLYYILLVSIPVLFRIWNWKAQCFAGIIALLAACGLWLPIESSATIISIILVAASAVLSTLVAVVRHVEEGDVSYASEDEEEIEQSTISLEKVKAAQFELRVWSTPFLQAVLVIVLIFFDLAFQGGLGSAQVGAKVNALIVVVLGMLLLKIVKPRLLAAAVVVSTICVAAAVTLARPISPSVVSSVIPIVCVAFTTVGLPWFFGRQLLIAWALTIVALLSRAVPLWTSVDSLFEVFALVLQNYYGEISLIAAGCAASVVVAHLVEQYYLTHFPQLIGETTLEDVALEENSLVIRKESIITSAKKNIQSVREKHLIRGMLFYGICSNFVSTVLLLEIDFSYWIGAAFGFLFFLIAWAVLIYLSGKKEFGEKAFLLGAFLALLLFLWPGVVMVFAQSGGLFWVFLPIGLFISIGLIPWTLAEAVPVVGCAFIAGAEILTRLDLGFSSVALLAFAGILSLLVASLFYQRVREDCLLTHFQDLMHESSNQKDALRILSDSLISVFDSYSALISMGREHLELLRSGNIYSLHPSTWPLVELRDQLQDFEVDRSGVGICPVNWLPEHLKFFDISFGEFSAPHGLLIELKSPLAQEAKVSLEQKSDTVASNREVNKRLLIFIPFRMPVVSFVKREELLLARNFASVTTLRLKTFLERELRAVQERLAAAKQSEREYELSALVHDINNTAQDLTLLCDSVLEGSDGEGGAVDSSTFGSQIRRIGIMARSMATVVSDAKRKRELERLRDLSPREVLDVTRVISEIMEIAIVRGERRRVKLGYANLKAENPVWVKISAREHLETILRNLLNNAITYSAPGSTVELSLRSDDDWVWVDVTDNGPGLSAEECESVFRSGVRGKAGSNVPGGLGLGLSQSRRVAEAAGGRLEAYSAGAGQGCTFTLTLPRQKAPEDRIEARESWALIVEDQPSLVTFYARIAKALYLHPAMAGSRAEAETLIDERGRPTFVLTELDMNLDDGIELVKLVRMKFDEKLPILVVSALNDNKIEQLARDAGATDFVNKPVGRQTLFARIQSLLPHS